jgi:hypothetical protein
MGIRKFFGSVLLLVSALGAAILWITLLLSEPLDPPDPLDELLDMAISSGIALLILFTFWVGLKLFTNEDADIQILNLSQKLRDENTQRRIEHTHR